ncbi:MAG: aminotransferase class V-fold PLP-dependent enzyme [Candidatus Kariarchaeaceae archaeon]|jgi:selenocysteine lyase/cysteine desulfurase
MSRDDLNVGRAREETPACKRIIHFNNAGASLMPEPVLNTVINHLKLEATIGGYEAATQEKQKIESVYDTIASLLNSKHDEIAVIENATRAWDMAFYSIPFKPGDRILTMQAEYVSNYLAFLQVAKRYKVKIDVVPNDQDSQVSINDLEKMIDDRVKLISIVHIPTNSGLVNPVTEIGKIAKEHDILYLLDACQSVGQMPIDVIKIGCDILTSTGRKYIRGPRGAGFLYVNKDRLEQLEPPFIDVHAAEWLSKDEYRFRSDAQRFENWETNIAGKLALGKAAEYAMEWGLDRIWERIQNLSNTFRNELDKITRVKVRDIGKIQCGIVTFTVKCKDPVAVRKLLYKEGINVSVSTKSSALLDMEARSLESVVRASIHYYNTEEEIFRFCEVIKTLIRT